MYHVWQDFWKKYEAMLTPVGSRQHVDLGADMRRR